MTGARGGASSSRGLDERRRRAFGGVDEVDDDVGVVERGERGAAHGALERVARIRAGPGCRG